MSIQDRHDEWINNPYKSSTMGIWMTDGLFYETCKVKSEAIYTLRSYDFAVKGIEYRSLRKIYVELMDPTEYTFAVEYLGGWEHWQKMCANAALGKEIDKWRDELEVKLRSQAVRSLMVTAVTEGAKGTTAAKWLADRGWLEKRGRPSKAEKEKRLKQDSHIKAEYEEDLERVQDLLN